MLFGIDIRYWSVIGWIKYITFCPFLSSWGLNNTSKRLLHRIPFDGVLMDQRDYSEPSTPSPPPHDWPPPWGFSEIFGTKWRPPLAMFAHPPAGNTEAATAITLLLFREKRPREPCRNPSFYPSFTLHHFLLHERSYFERWMFSVC